MTPLRWTDPRHPWMRDHLILLVPDHHRWCAWCGDLMPAEARTTAIYCQRRCKFAATNQRRRDRA